VHHVDCKHRVGVLNRPLLVPHVNGERLAHIRQPCLGDPRRDGHPHLRVGVARLPCKLWHRGSEVHDVLTRAARDFEHEPGLGQHAPKDREDGVLVPLGGRCGERDGRHACIHENRILNAKAWLARAKR
jgi:hypothetical protein